MQCNTWVLSFVLTWGPRMPLKKAVIPLFAADTSVLLKIHRHGERGKDNIITHSQGNCRVSYKIFPPWLNSGSFDMDDYSWCATADIKFYNGFQVLSTSLLLQLLLQNQVNDRGQQLRLALSFCLCLDKFYFFSFIGLYSVLLIHNDQLSKSIKQTNNGTLFFRRKDRLDSVNLISL